MNSNSITCYYKQITFTLPTSINTCAKLFTFANQHFTQKYNKLYYKHSHDTYYTLILSQEDFEDLLVSDYRYLFIGKESLSNTVVENGISSAYIVNNAPPSFISNSAYRPGDCIKLQFCCKCKETLQHTYTILACKHQCHTKCATNYQLKCKDCNN